MFIIKNFKNSKVFDNTFSVKKPKRAFLWQKVFLW